MYIYIIFFFLENLSVKTLTTEPHEKTFGDDDRWQMYGLFQEERELILLASF